MPGGNIYRVQFHRVLFSSSILILPSAGLNGQIIAQQSWLLGGEFLIVDNNLCVVIDQVLGPTVFRTLSRREHEYLNGLSPTLLLVFIYPF